MSHDTAMTPTDEEFWNLHKKLMEHHVALMKDRSIDLFDSALNGNPRAIVDLCAPYVTKVTVRAEACRDRHVELLKKLLNLEELKLSTCKRLTDESLLHISKMSSLKRLDIKELHSKEITLNGIMLLSRLKGIELIRFPFALGGGGILESRELDKIKAKLRQALPNTAIN